MSPGCVTIDRGELEKALSSTFVWLFRSADEIKMDVRGSAKVLQGSVQGRACKRTGREQRAKRQEAELQAALRTTAGADLFASFVAAVQEPISISPQTPQNSVLAPQQDPTLLQELTNQAVQHLRHGSLWKRSLNTSSCLHGSGTSRAPAISYSEVCAGTK